MVSLSHTFTTSTQHGAGHIVVAQETEDKQK